MHRIGSTALGFCLLVAIAVPSDAAASLEAAPGPIDVEIVQVSTPDSGFGLGRTMRPAYVFADLRIAEYDVDRGGWYPSDTGTPILVTMAVQPSRLAGYDSPQNNGPGWLSFIDLTQLQVGTTRDIVPNTPDYSLTLIFDDRVQTPMEGRCPDFAGTYTVHEVQLGSDGMPESLALSYVVTCGSSDTTWGSMAYNAVLPALPSEANDLADEDLGYPHPTGDRGPGIVPDHLAVNVRGNSLLTAWGDGDGFRCAAVNLQPRGGGDPLEYVGNDDTHAFTALDTTASYDLHVAFDWQSPQPILDCEVPDEPYYQDELSVLATTVNVRDASAPLAAQTSVLGSVSTPVETPASQEPLTGADVELWRSVDGEDTLLQHTSTNSAGEFTFVVPNWNTKTLWVELPARDPSVELPVGWFAQTSNEVTLTSEHIVTVVASDKRVTTGSSLAVSARLRPRGESSPLLLQRRNQQGAWVTVDATDAIPHSATSLTLPRTREGWQALRVLAPTDDRHGPGASERIRIYGQ